jgi:hypothetical protein
MAPILRNFRTLSAGAQRGRAQRPNCPELTESQIVDDRTFSRQGVLWVPAS